MANNFHRIKHTFKKLLLGFLLGLLLAFGFLGYQFFKELKEIPLSKFHKEIGLIESDLQSDDWKGTLLQNNACEEMTCFQVRLPFDLMPSSAWKILIGIEDYRFIEHGGIDYFSIMRAFVKNLSSMRLAEGGSTLTQQVIKNLILSNKKSFSRKVREALLAVYIEFKLEKEDILELYLNEVFWGTSQGVQVKGLYAASLFYFQKRPDELDMTEVSILISLLKGPSFYSPFKHSERLKERVNVVIKRLEELSIFPKESEYHWDDKKWASWITTIKSNEEDRPLHSLWELSRMKKRGRDLTLDQTLVFIDSSHAMVEMLKKEKKLNLAVKAIIGTPWKKESTPIYYYSKVERSLEAGIESETMSIGSTVKPFVYQEILKRGKKWDDLVSTAPIILNLPSGKWTPRDHGVQEGTMTVKDALMESRNVPLIHLVEELGRSSFQAPLEHYFGQLAPLNDYPAQFLGSIELSVRELYDSYTKLLEEVCVAGNFDDSLFAVLSDPNLTTVSKTLPENLKAKRFFGKTGTTNRSLDNWFVFYDGHYLGVIWIGVDDKRTQLKDLRLAGASTAFLLYADWVSKTLLPEETLSCPLFEK